MQNIDHRSELEELRHEYQKHMSAEPNQSESAWSHWWHERRAMQERESYLRHWIFVLHGENATPIGS